MVDLKTIPLKPGCYIIKDAQGVIIYIGKAKSLRKRLRYYEKLSNDTSPHIDDDAYIEKTKKMVGQAQMVETVVTETEVSALILEAELIKKHKPKYNIALKDSIKYSYIKITQERYPRFEVVRDIKKDKAYYFGPYASAYTREQALKVLRDFFQIRTCKRMPKHACLNFYIKKCTAPCIGEISYSEYKKSVDMARHFLSGKTKQVLEELRELMKKYAQMTKYERAQSIRDQIAALENMADHKSLLEKKPGVSDYIDYLQVGKEILIQLFRMEHGVLAAKNEYRFEYYPGVLADFITQRYAFGLVPEKLYVREPLAAEEVIQAYLTEKRGEKVEIIQPKRGEHKKMLDLVKKNIVYSPQFEHGGLTRLQEVLYLPSVPQRIECFDISTLQGTNTVASMVTFVGGKALKDEYRRFKIRLNTEGVPDDFAAMAEVVQRRYARQLKENNPLPDLIVIDGGLGQLGVADMELQKLGIRVPIIGLAKKEELIVTLGRKKPIRLKRNDKGLQLLQKIRDEAHRFAVSYHRLLRGKQQVGKNKKR